MSLVIEQIHNPSEDARRLIGELNAELNAAYPQEQRHGLTLDGIFQPNVLFFIARLDGDAVGCGGVAFEDGLAEVKRMYVRPLVRGQNVAASILARLEQEARGRGIARLVLETGDAQLAAQRFYQREGFSPCPIFGRYATMPPRTIGRSRFFEKPLT